MKRREEPIPGLSAGLSYVMMTGLFMLAARSGLPPPLEASAAAMMHLPATSGAPPSTSVSKPPATPAASGSPPTASPSDEVAAQPVKEEWPAEDIARGREQCMHLLSGVSAEIEYLEPIKKGACGLPAPVRLKSVGADSNKVVFDPPVDVNCRMVAALGSWVKSTLQPEARERFQSGVVRIVRASGYSCRNIYNLPNAKLSQHALANAIDIGGFALANGRTVGVLKGWGLTARDIKALKAKAEADAKAKAKRTKDNAAELEKAKAKAEDGDAAPAGKAGRPEKTGVAVTQASLTPSMLKLQKKPVVADAPEAKASKLAETEKPVVPAKPTKEALFLRAIHGGACGEFGTVLGPEANDPHRNHFHLDLISRRGRGYCE